MTEHLGAGDPAHPPLLPPRRGDEPSGVATSARLWIRRSAMGFVRSPLQKPKSKIQIC